MRRYGNWMGLSVSGSMKRSVQESGRCVQFRWLRYTEQTGFTEKPVRKSQDFCLKERNRESGFWMERKSTEKWYGRECRKYFQKKAAVLKKNNIWKFQKTGICGECSIKSGWQGLLYPQICSYLHLPYREQQAVGYLHDLEIKVPEEIEVMAVGKEETALICRPQLTTVEFDKKRFVRQVIEELYVQMIKGYILTKSGKISVKTIIRGSCN